MPGLTFEDGVREVSSDSQVLDMVKACLPVGYVNIYVEHWIDEAMQTPSDLEYTFQMLKLIRYLGVADCEGDDLQDLNGDGQNMGDGLDIGVGQDINDEHDMGRGQIVGGGQLNVNEKYKGKMVVEDDSDSDYGEYEEFPCGPVPINAHSDYSNPNELLTPPGSDEDIDHNRRPKFTEFKNTKIKHIQFDLGQIFASPDEFKKAVKGYAVANGHDIRFTKNDKNRVCASCVPGCPWKIRASWMQDEMTFQIKTLYPTHSCTRSFKNRQITSTFLANHFMKKISQNLDWKTKAFQHHVKFKLSTSVSRGKIYRAKKKALDVVDGSHRGKFNKLWDYCEALKKGNPGSTVHLFLCPWCITNF